MKVQALLVASLMIFSAVANAQGGQTSARQSDTYERPYAAKGVRFGLFASALEFEVEAERGNNKSSSDDLKIDQTVGISAGYAWMPVGRVGFTGALSFMEVTEKEDGEKGTLALGRIDGNVGYAVNEMFYFKGGLNVSSFMQSDTREELGPSIGLQTYLGLQFTKNLGAELGYVYMTQRGEIDSILGEIEVTSIFRGLELQLTGTF
jgi:hypothetical protein